MSNHYYHNFLFFNTFTNYLSLQIYVNGSIKNLPITLGTDSFPVEQVSIVNAKATKTNMAAKP